MANEDLSKLRIDKSGIMQYQSARKRLLFRIITFALIVIIGIVLYWVVFHGVVEVRVSTVSQMYPSQTFTILNASGYVVAQRKASVASKVTGRLEWLGVEEGSQVKKGQVIARLEGEDVKAAREQAKANVNNAVSNWEMAKVELEDATLHYNRQKELLSHGIVPRSEFDVAEARYKKAKASVAAAGSAIHAYKAALHSADVTFKYTFIRAPFNAVVLTKDADVGDIVTPLGAAANAKAAVVTIADMNSLVVETDVSESNLQKVTVDQPCEIQLDALPEIRFRGIVHMIVPTADRSKASVMVKVKFLDRNDQILPEMSAKVSFLERPVTPEEQKPKIILDPGTIVTHNSNEFVFVVKEDRAIKTPIAIGVQTGNMVEILTGIKPGDKVVVNPPINLKDGSKVSILQGKF